MQRASALKTAAKLQSVTVLVKCVYVKHVHVALVANAATTIKKCVWHTKPLLWERLLN